MRSLGSIAISLALAATATLPPLEVHVRRVGGALEVRLVLNAKLPEPITGALPSGAQVNVKYQLRVRRRRAVLWDPRVWRGEAVSSVVFDPVTGRYRCELLLNDVIVESRETESAATALLWLRSPPAFRLLLPRTRHALRLSARAVFATGGTWLVFPTAKGTSWITVPVEGPP